MFDVCIVVALLKVSVSAVQLSSLSTVTVLYVCHSPWSC